MKESPALGGSSVDAELSVLEQGEEEKERGQAGKCFQARPSQENQMNFNREIFIYGIGSTGIRDLKKLEGNIEMTWNW